MKEYSVYYRKRGDKSGQIFNCTVTVNNKREARKNFKEWDNEHKEWTIVNIERI